MERKSKNIMVKDIHKAAFQGPRKVSNYRVQDKLNDYGKTPERSKASIIFHLELVPEIFQSGSQYS
jgi:hypothetical protein